ncbi:helix-turn-helix transcriptional regulator [Cellulomonas sp. ICMP 17802]|uniref:helix-turn-helix transcriptional regulator n=1 Tax=Cellulomonas sp. ICMP 17802 TaxID=3239199 RepID=UPI00351BC1B6
MADDVWARVHSPVDLGAVLRELREQADLSQEAVADELGIDRRYVYQLETGTPNLYTTRLFALLRLLGAHLEVTTR